MKNITRILLFIAFTGSVIATVYLGRRAFDATQQSTLFSTQRPTKRTITRLIYAEGTLEASEQARMGPMINGTIEKIFVKDDQHVTKGTLLATINNGIGGDTDVRATKANLAKATAAATYARLHHARQQSLFASEQLAKDAYENSLRSLQEQEADLLVRQAEHDKASATYGFTRVTAPYDGTVLSVFVREGEGISVFSVPPTIMFELVKDFSAMQVNLSIDESRMGSLKKGMSVKFTVDAFPKKHWTGIISALGKAPFIKHNTPERTVTYKAVVDVQGDHEGLLTGMSAHAKIKLSKTKNALCLPGHVFHINPIAVQHVAKQNGYVYQALDEATKKALKKQYDTKTLNTVWVVKNKSFIETPIKIGVDDNAYFEIIEGITPEDDIVFDVTETDSMRAFMKQVMGGGL